jgi:hypothetical protein
VIWHGRYRDCYLVHYPSGAQEICRFGLANQTIPGYPPCIAEIPMLELPVRVQQAIKAGQQASYTWDIQGSREKVTWAG